MLDIFQFCLSFLSLSVAVFLFYLMYKKQSLITKNYNLNTGEGEAKTTKKSKYTLREILILFIILIILLTVSFVSSASNVNVNSNSTATVIINSVDKESGPKINLNTATKEELMYLSGIGEIKADDIIKYRQQHEFINASELLNIIGAKSYHNIMNAVTTED